MPIVAKGTITNRPNTMMMLTAMTATSQRCRGMVLLGSVPLSVLVVVVVLGGSGELVRGSIGERNGEREGWGRDRERERDRESIHTISP